MARSLSNKTPRRPRTTKRVSLRHLAELAAVDLSTVSRALNNDPRISQERSSAIRALANKLGYRPRPLRTKRTGAIGLIIASSQLDRPDDQFLYRISWLVQQAVGDHRLHVNVECVQRSAEGESNVALPAIVAENRVDGVIVAGHPPVDLITRIRELRVPVVAINDSIERLGVSCVRSDPTAAINDAILRLAAWGHREFGLVMDNLTYPTYRARHKAYLAALRAVDITPDPAWVALGFGPDITCGRQALRELTRRGPLPTAIFCGNDWIALGVMQELQRNGIDIPGQISLIGHDDLPFCDNIEPSITSIRRSEDLLVTKAVNLLIEQINAGDAVSVTEQFVHGQVVWRSSTGPNRPS